MSERFITNQDELLKDVMGRILPNTKSMDILVGYFYFSGFQQLWQQIGEKKIRILVGLDVDKAVRNGINECYLVTDKTGNSSKTDIKNEYCSSLRDVINETDLFDTKGSQESFIFFCEKLKNKSLEIRKTEAPCHAKMYLFEYLDTHNEEGQQPGALITGSSNLSHSGLGGRIEINTRFTDKPIYNEGKAIFEKLWGTAVKISFEDFDEQVIKHIWYEKLYKPYLMYVRVLDEYFSLPDVENLISIHDITQGRYFNLKYQIDAVKMAIHAINTHSGVIVADVVGLGKSIIASTVAHNLRLKTIIITPPHLENQWKEYKSEFSFTAEIFTNGKIEDALKHYYSMAKKQDEQILVIIDEAHKYRNEKTQNYAMLHKLCANNKVMLLTATPYNNAPSDIYSLVKLFQIPACSTLQTVDHLGNHFGALIRQYNVLLESKRKDKKTESEVKETIAEIANRIRDIIAPLVVRRSRLDLLHIDDYREDLKRQKIAFSEVAPPMSLTYDLTEIRATYIDTLQKIATIDEEEKAITYRAVRFQAAQYVKDECKADLAKKIKQQTNLTYDQFISTQKNLSIFMRRLLVRRFESSLDAFQKTLTQMIEGSRKVLGWIEKRQTIPIYKRGYLPDIESFYDEDNIGEVLNDKFEHFQERGLFEIDMKYIRDDFVFDVQKDLDLLVSIKAMWKDANDAKLKCFKEILCQKLAAEPQRKLIVFSEFADTVNYLASALKKEGFKVFSYTSSDASTSNKETIRSNFDAGYNPKYQEDQYQILIATDAISEGYNLHRAGTIFNYDIPFNPTRVIQRVGRINRINKKMYDKLHIYNYFPSDIGENETRIKEIATLKMKMIHLIMGEDTKILTDDEEPNAFFKSRYEKEIKVNEAESWETPYRNLYNSLLSTHEMQEARKIPYRARIGRRTQYKEKGVLVFGRKGNEYVFKVGAGIDYHTLPPQEALHYFEATECEKSFKVSDSFEDNYQYVKSHLFHDDDTKSPPNNKLKIEALKQLNALKVHQLIDKDYASDLEAVINDDDLNAYDMTLVKNTKPNPESIKALYNAIDSDYLSARLRKKSKIRSGEELLILTEEFQ